ncbi:hypothetical protein ACQI4F_09570 [Mycolicibacterium vaccae]|uniref:hypothetical protein n=1 Tax=Mycolicibacterium vaccae TaxID=1810 RepID=UPI003CE71883
MKSSRRYLLRDQLRQSGAQWSRLAEAHGTPLLVLEPHRVARRFDELRAALPEVGHVLATGVSFAGFSFHVGSQSPTVEPYRRALGDTLGLITHLRDALGVDTRVLDIGGASRSPIATTCPPSTRSPRSSTTCSATNATAIRCSPNPAATWPPTP